MHIKTIRRGLSAAHGGVRVDYHHYYKRFIVYLKDEQGRKYRLWYGTDNAVRACEEAASKNPTNYNQNDNPATEADDAP